jgi:pyruvate kinase
MLAFLQTITVTAEYDKKGNESLIACSYPKIAEDLKPGNQILCADGSLVLSVDECLPKEKCVRCTAVNTATIGCAFSLFSTCSRSFSLHFTLPHAVAL